MTLAGLLVVLPIAIFAAAYLLYPGVLRILVAVRRDDRRPWPEGDPEEWPRLSLLVPAYNEEGVIRAKLENLLAVDYPVDRRQVVVVSDASTDRTDEIVREFADRGVELVRIPERAGKIQAQNAAVGHLRGDIVVNTDASTRLLEGSLKALVRPFRRDDVGVASGHNRSVGRPDSPAADGEAGYVSFEMWVRALETRLGGIVGASGALYAVRRPLFSSVYPSELSRDFGTVMLARRSGYRAVSVDDAVCLVPRSGSVRGELRRKTRTMARGLRTLWHFRGCLNPFRYGGFALKLLGHKLGRWLTYLTLPPGLIALGWLAIRSPVAALALSVGSAVAALGVGALLWPEEAPGRQRPMPRAMAVSGYLVTAGVAGALAWYRALTGRRNATWEPTRRQFEDQDTTSASAMRG